MSIPLSPETICNGEAMEELKLAIQEVLQNITDTNTPATAKRSATLTIEFKPNKERNIAGVSASVTTKLAPIEAKTTSVLIDKNLKTGKVEAAEMGTGQAPDQHEIPGAFHTNVSPFNKAQEG